MSIEGTIEARRAQQVTWEPGQVGDVYCPGDSLRVPQWRAAILLRNETIIRLDAGTTITFTEFEEDKPAWLDVLQGIVHFLSQTPRRLNVTTPFVNAAVEGTEFVVRVEAGAARIWLFQGQLLVRNDLGSLTLASGQVVVAEAGQAPRRVVVIRPRDAVQWALYYPPLVDYRAVQVPGPAAQAVGRALERYRKGDVAGALSMLEEIPQEQRDAEFFTLRAGMLLSVGRVERARADIAEALRRDQDNGLALALQSVIAVVQNEKEQALERARQAAERAPKSAVPYIALSYAYQAVFDIEKASEHAQRAAELAPEDALVWARVAELWLARGYIDRAMEAAEKAVERNPDLSRPQTVLGFARLRRESFSTPASQNPTMTFEKAITLDQADPLPRLGLGLAKIRESHLTEGRREIEIAASLHPNDSVIRSYLGKAYFEEKRDPLDGEQYEIAKELDPHDPTPWFYDAIRKQLINRPVEALHDLRRSIRLNDNRAVYRSRLLLDEDQAARNAAIGRIYRNLGFLQRGLVEGWYSLALNPASHSAHRLLSDSYSTLPRHEIARVSELLQAQLLQDLNTNNLQPQLAEASLPILEAAGPTTVAFNEFNPLFMRDGTRVFANGLIGSQETWGGDGVLSGIQGPLSYSVGAFRFTTDGFRKNNDLEHEIYNVFVQGAVTPKVNVQGEFRTRESEQGDLEMRFDPDDLRPNDRTTTEQDTARLGIRFEPAPHSTAIVSAVQSTREGLTRQGSVTVRGKSEAYKLEGQYLFRHERLNVVLGGGRTFVDTNNRVAIAVGPITIRTSDVFESVFANGYGYVNMEWPRSVVWTGGLSLESLDERGLDQVRVNPKAGVQWNISDAARLRLAYLQTLKQRLIIEATVEPTQVAGFNQFFDDTDGSLTELYGVALDTVPTDDLYVGIMYFLRNIESPVVSTATLQTTRFDRWEDFFKAYLYWTLHRHWALTAEAQFDQFRRPVDEPLVTAPNRRDPTQIKTISTPLALKYFHPSGLFAGVKGTYVRQELDLAPTSTLSRRTDEFLLVDASIGYRFPNRLGLLSIEVNNLFDQDIFFIDETTQRARGFVLPRFLPDRTVLARLTLNF